MIYHDITWHFVKKENIIFVKRNYSIFVAKIMIARSSLAYLIFVIFFTRAKFLENKIYTEKRQFFALNL